MRSRHARLGSVALCALALATSMHSWSPTVYPTGVTVYDPSKAYNSYVLFDGRDGKSYLIDMNGNDVNVWNYSGFPVEMIDPALAGGVRGRVLAQKEPDTYANKTVLELDWDSNVVWEWGAAAPDGRAGQTHDLARLSNGNTLILSMRDVVSKSISVIPVRDQVIFEVAPGGDIVWKWVASEHLDEFGISPAGMTFLRGPRARRRSSLLTINNMTPVGPNKWYDARDTRFHPDNIIIDSREANFIAIIDKRTGRVVWRMGPEYPGALDFSTLRNARQVPRPVDQISGQHDAHLIPPGLPGAGNLLVFDNQGTAGLPPVPLSLFMGSRVLEIDPIKKEIVWQYDGASSKRQMWSFFSVFISSARRLPNGNTLINEGMNGRMFQVTPAGEIVWEYVNRHFGRWVDHDTESGGEMTNWVYRAQPIPYAWVPDGTPRSEKPVGAPTRAADATGGFRGRAGDLTLVPYVVEVDDGRQREPAELGRLLVPENRRDPNSRLIEIAFVRLKSTAENPGPPLIFLAGGPGGSGIDVLHRAGGFAFARRLREAGDVIFLDQRSTGMSLPKLACPVVWELPLDRPADRDSVLAAARNFSKECDAFWHRHGVDRRGYTTIENAADVDAVRQAIGAAKINLYGASYGSHLALATIRAHGANVHRAVIPLVEGPDHSVKTPGNIQRQMETIDQLTRADRSLWEKMPDFLGTVRHVLERLERMPVQADTIDPVTKQKVSVRIGKMDLQWITATGLGVVDFIKKLPARYYAMAHGDFSWAALEVLRTRRSPISMNAMTYYMDCASGLSEQRRANIARDAPVTLLGEIIDFPFPYLCDAWGNLDTGAEFRLPVKSDVPALFISGSIDGRTPVSNADEVRAGFSNHHHVVVEGMSHGHPDFMREMAPMMVKFLQGSPPSISRMQLRFTFDAIK